MISTWMLWKIWNLLLLKHLILWNDSCVSDEMYHVYRSWGCVGPNHLRSIPWIKNHEQPCQINPNNLLETMGRFLYASDSFTIHYSFDCMILNDCNWYEMCRSTTNQNTKPKTVAKRPKQDPNHPKISHRPVTNQAVKAQCWIPCDWNHAEGKPKLNITGCFLLHHFASKSYMTMSTFTLKQNKHLTIDR